MIGLCALVSVIEAVLELMLMLVATCLLAIRLLATARRLTAAAVRLMTSGAASASRIGRAAATTCCFEDTQEVLADAELVEHADASLVTAGAEQSAVRIGHGVVDGVGRPLAHVAEAAPTFGA